MPIVQICDADGKTVLKAGEEKKTNWGYDRVYSEEAMVAVEKYFLALQEGAKACRELFDEYREQAIYDFHEKYPDGKLPDEAEDADGAV